MRENQNLPSVRLGLPGCHRARPAATVTLRVETSRQTNPEPKGGRIKSQPGHGDGQAEAVHSAKRISNNQRDLCRWSANAFMEQQSALALSNSGERITGFGLGLSRQTDARVKLDICTPSQRILESASPGADFFPQRNQPTTIDVDRPRH